MAHSTPDIRSTAACLWFTLRCAYRFVICAARCPRSSPTVCKSTPAITSLLAKVCQLQSQALQPCSDQVLEQLEQRDGLKAFQRIRLLLRRRR
jgi:hypothetical protein